MTESHARSRHSLSVQRRLLFASIALVGAPLVVIGAVELSLRLFWPQEDVMRWFRRHPRYGYVQKANFSQDYRYRKPPFTMAVRTNSMGHRHPEYDAARLVDDRVTKVLIIGDSFVFGHGVNMERHFATQLHRLLNVDGGNYMIINAGVGGWGTVQSTMYARDHMATFNPSVIVYAFCGNDPVDDDKFAAGLADNERGAINFPGKVFVRNHSHLYRFLFAKFHSAVHRVLMKRKTGGAYAGTPDVDPQSAMVISESDWEQTLTTIREFHSEYTARIPDGRLLVVATAPWNVNIREHLRSLHQPPSIEYVDAYEATFPLTAAERRLPHDAHWGVKMHDVMARELATVIMQPDTVRD